MISASTPLARTMEGAVDVIPAYADIAKKYLDK